MKAKETINFKAVSLYTDLNNKPILKNCQISIELIKDLKKYSLENLLIEFNECKLFQNFFLDKKLSQYLTFKASDFTFSKSALYANIKLDISDQKVLNDIFRALLKYSKNSELVNYYKDQLFTIDTRDFSNCKGKESILSFCNSII